MRMLDSYRQELENMPIELLKIEIDSLRDDFNREMSNPGSEFRGLAEENLMIANSILKKKIMANQSNSKCLSCGSYNSSSAIFCQSCGDRL